MNKLIAALIPLLLSGASLFGQGTVNFANAGVGVNARLMIVHNYGFPNAAEFFPSGTNYMVALWVGELGSTEAQLRQATAPAYFHTDEKAGYFTGGSRVLSYPAGTPLTAQIRVWRGAATWLELGTTLGEGHKSRLFTVVPTVPPSVPANLTNLEPMIFLRYLCQAHFNGFTQQPVSQSVSWGGPVTFGAEASACPGASKFQWYFNGQLIKGANASTLTLPSVTEEHAGNYFAVFTHPYWGSRSSATATLTVRPDIQLALLPQSQTAERGSAVRFAAGATGKPPLEFQWRQNGADLAGATGATLQLQNVGPDQAGNYSVRVSNGAGTTNSPAATLAIIDPVQRAWVPGIRLLGESGSIVRVEAIADPGITTEWPRIGALRMNESPEWMFDLPIQTQRFYRAWTTVTNRPTISMHFVPEITLTGAIGNNLRLEGINRFGPTDAWLPVANVILTNTTQIYRDTSAVGQPPRLWRIRTNP